MENRMKERRQSKLREEIYNAIVQHPVHPTAESIYEQLKATYPSLSLGTVYRNLGILTEQGLIRRIDTYDAADRFDGNMQPHSHIQCRQCGRLEDVFLPYDGQVDQMVERMTGFQVEGHAVLFSGICSRCKVTPEDGRQQVQ